VFAGAEVDCHLRDEGAVVLNELPAPTVPPPVIKLMLRRSTTASLALMIAFTAIACGCTPAPKRIGMEEARAMFASRGVQPGQALPPLSLVTLDGQPTSISQIQDGRPMVVATASLTCNIARRQQRGLDDLRKRFGDSVAVVVIYTIDAHPKGDPCPYTGEEWVPKDNERDEVLVRQPENQEQRLALAREYQRRFSDNALLLVDTPDNASWLALGSAPNLGLLVDGTGVVRVRQGWLDTEAMTKELEAQGVP